MKNLFVTLIVLLFTLMSVHCQTPEKKDSKKFNTVLEVFNDFQRNVPDSVKSKLINNGISFFGYYELPIGKSQFSFAVGSGISSHNFYHNALIKVDSLNVTRLYPIGTLYPNISYKINKLNLAYLDFPLELRLRTKNDIRAALGFRIGVKINSHSKYKGDDYLNQSGKLLHVKFKNVQNTDDLRYGIAMRIGWKFINLTGFYSLSSFFENDKGPQIAPISVGISLMPF